MKRDPLHQTAANLFRPRTSAGAPPRLRMLYIDHTAVLSGGELAMLALLRHMDPAAVESAVVLGATGPLANELEALVPTLILPISQRLLDTRKASLSGNAGVLLRAALAVPYVLRLARLIRAARPDVVHTNSLKADLLGGIAARLAGVPLIWHVRDRIAPDYLPPAAVFAFRKLCRWIPNSIVGCSQAVLDTLELPPAIPRAVVYSGIDLASFPSRPARAATMPDAPVLGFVGRLAPWKGQHIFLAAAAILHSSFPRARYVVVGTAMFGETDYEAELRALVARHGLEDVVEFRGFVREIEHEIQQFDLLVHASTSPEPFGQTIVQGMAAGIPVVAATGGGASEIVRDGYDGLLVERGNAPALAAALHSVLADPQLAQTLASNGRRRVEEMFTIQRSTATLLRVVRAIARRPSGPVRVLFYNATARVSGGEVVLRNILEELTLAPAPASFEITVACPDGALADQVHALGYPTLPIPELTLRFTRNPLQLLGYLRSLWRTALTLRAAVRRTRPQVVHANSIRAGLVSLFATLGFPVVLQWHVHDTLPPRFLSLLTRFAALLSPRNRLLAVSESTARNLASGFLTRRLRARTSVLLNAVRMEALPAPSAGAYLRASLALPADAFCVLHVGQIARRKNQLGAVRAFHAAFGNEGSAHLLLAGSPMFEGAGEYLREIEHEIAERSLTRNVHLLGYRSDARELMASCDLVLLNSLGDPCPLTILEAMAAGSAILASRVDGIPELIADGETGWLADPLSEPAFASALRTIASLSPAQRKSIGEAARTAVAERTLPAYVARWAEITRANLFASLPPAPQPLNPVLANGANEYAGN